MCTKSKNKISVFFLLSILFAAILMRIFLSQGYVGSDDHVYAELASRIAKGNFNVSETYTRVPVFPLRLGLLIPTALCFKIWGITPLACSLYPLLISCLMVGLSFWAGCLFYDRRAGFIAAILIAFLPMEIQTSASLYPDAIGAFWGNLAILLLYKGYLSKTRKTKLLCGTSSGLCLGFYWLCKLSVIYLLPFVGYLFLWVVYRGRKNVFLVSICLAVFLSIIVMESALYYKTKGDILFRYHETERNYEVCKIHFFSEGSIHGWEPGEYASSLLKRVFYRGPNTIFLNKMHGWLPAWGMIALLYALWRRKREAIFPGLWLLILIILYNFGSSSMTTYRPLILYDRYLSPMYLPGAILVAGWLSYLVGTKEKRENELGKERLFLAILVIIGLCYPYSWGIIKSIENKKLFHDLYVVSKLVRPEDGIYTDTRTAKMLNFYWGFPDKEKVTDFKNLSAQDIKKGDYVLVNPKKLEYLIRTYQYAPPYFYRNIPPDWNQIWQCNKLTLYQSLDPND